ncbi:MAG: VWA domain-containing protein, partial [Verrucomicrobiales bacterium]
MKSPLLPLAWSCFLTLLPWAAKAQSASDAARVIIVFDASGSMAGEVPGGPKIEVAKKVVSDLVSKLDPSVQLGLMAYGHRKKGDCEDIELLVAPASNTREAILSAVAKLQP